MTVVELTTLIISVVTVTAVVAATLGALRWLVDRLRAPDEYPPSDVGLDILEARASPVDVVHATTSSRHARVSSAPTTSR